MEHWLQAKIAMEFNNFDGPLNLDPTHILWPKPFISQDLTSPPSHWYIITSKTFFSRSSFRHSSQFLVIPLPNQNHPRISTLFSTLYRNGISRHPSFRRRAQSRASVRRRAQPPREAKSTIVSPTLHHSNTSKEVILLHCEISDSEASKWFPYVTSSSGHIPFESHLLCLFPFPFPWKL